MSDNTKADDSVNSDDQTSKSNANLKSALESNSKQQQGAGYCAPWNRGYQSYTAADWQAEAEAAM